MKASIYGISKYDLQKEVSIGLAGKKASVFKQNGSEFDIIVKGDMCSKEELENLAIKSTSTGQKVILKEIAQIELVARIPNIKKYDREITVSIFSDVVPGLSAVKLQDKFILLAKKTPSSKHCEGGG